MKLSVIGGGLAGCEAAWQAAERGLDVQLFEMRPACTTGAHTTDKLAELVCSNSLGSTLSNRATGLLQEELRILQAFLISCADQCRVPAGGALAVDRTAFAELVTQRILDHPRIQVIREEVSAVPDGLCIMASGPLTSPALSDALCNWTGRDHLAFFDALAPIVDADSLDPDIVFRASRYERGGNAQGDYLNCPFCREEYYAFIDALLNAPRIPLHSFETRIEQGVRAGMHQFFEGCLPVEIMAERGRDTLAYGPMRPVGLADPRTGQRPFAVLQLRQDNLSASLFGMVGFQTNLTYAAQKRVFSMIPGLAQAIFVRYGQMHRNTFIASPLLLSPALQSKKRPDLLFAGQLTGMEGYTGNIGSGCLAGINAARIAHNRTPLILPAETMLGALLHYITSVPVKDFQPMKANFGILPPLEGPRVPKKERGTAYAQRALQAIRGFSLQ